MEAKKPVLSGAGPSPPHEMTKMGTQSTAPGVRVRWQPSESRNACSTWSYLALPVVALPGKWGVQRRRYRAVEMGAQAKLRWRRPCL